MHKNLREEGFYRVPYNEIEKKHIKLALEDILSSQGFSNSAQLQNFLSFIVTKTLEDKTQDIKGYTIGVDALGRPEDFDPQLDPSVRVMAGRLRQALENYDRDTGGFTQDNQTVRIELVKGSYVPKIEFQDAQEVQTEKYKDKLSALETNDIDIGLAKIVPTPKSIDSKFGFKNIALACIALIAVGLGGYSYYLNQTRIEPTVLPEKQVLTIEDSTLPSLTLLIDAKQNLMPDWITPEKLQSIGLIAFSRFKEYRVFNYRDEDDLLYANQFNSDYSFTIYFSKAPNNDALEAFMNLTRGPDTEVIWSGRFLFPRLEDDNIEMSKEKISTITFEIMSPYGIIHGDITSNENPPPRLDCIRAIYSYFAKEDLQSYANGLDCARRVVNRPNASSSMYAMITFLYVEAFRKQIVEVSTDPLDTAYEYAEKSILLDPGNARAFQAMFAVEKTKRNFDAAEKAAQRAMALNPYDRDILGDYASYLVAINEQEKAKPVLEKAVALTPVLPAWLAFYAYLNADVTGDHKKADTLAATFKPETSPLIAAAIILSAQRSNNEKKIFAAVQALNIMEPGFVTNPEAALIRRGFEETFANTIAICPNIRHVTVSYLILRM